MRVDYNFCQTNNTFASMNGVNRSLARNNPAPNGQTAGAGRKDRVSISPQGKMMNMIDSLNKQKEAIRESRGELVSRTLKSGGNMKTIETQLELFAEQLETIDNQITNIYAQMAKDAAEQIKTNKPDKATDENKDEEQLETEHLTDIASLSSDVKQAETVAAVKRKVVGEAHVKETEIDRNQLRIDILKSRGQDGKTNVKDMIASEKRDIKKKTAELSELQEKTSALSEAISKKLSSTAEKLSNSSSAKVKDEDTVSDNDKDNDKDNQAVDTSNETPTE